MTLEEIETLKERRAFIVENASKDYGLFRRELVTASVAAVIHLTCAFACGFFAFRSTYIPGAVLGGALVGINGLAGLEALWLVFTTMKVLQAIGLAQKAVGEFDRQIEAGIEEHNNKIHAAFRQ